MVCIHPDARHHNTGLDAKTITNDHYTPKEDIQKMTREIFQRDMNTDVRRLWWRKMMIAAVLLVLGGMVNEA